MKIVVIQMMIGMAMVIVITDPDFISSLLHTTYFAVLFKKEILRRHE